MTEKPIKYISAILLCLSLSLFVPASALSEEISTVSVREFSLKEAIDTAFRTNKDIQIQEEAIGIAKADILGAKSAFWPKLSAKYGYTYNGFAFNLGAIAQNSKKDPGIFSGYQSDNLASVTVNETIYNGGADIAVLKETRLGLKVQEETLRARKLDVAFETKRLYYGLLLAYETERITENLLHQAKAHYADVKSKFEQGTSSKFDVLQSSVQVSKVMPEVVRAKNSIQLIMVEFKKLLGINMFDDIKIKGRLAYTPSEIKEADYLKEAYKANPQIILKLLGIDISKWQIEYAKSGYYPQVDASFGYNYRSNNLNTMFDYRHTNWAAGVSVGLSIFDGMSTKSKVDAAKAKYSQSTIEKENVTDQVVVDIKNACLDMKEADAIVISQRDAIVEAKDALRIAEIGYDNGVTTNLDVLDTQVSLSQVEKNLSEGIYDYLVARAQLDRVMGRESYAEEK
ncbi:MAG: TolC family protein [Candidatus Omnitrophica bacterium]|nr:TolC family protein [Candidatus Omnitrophota bacterium]